MKLCDDSVRSFMPQDQQAQATHMYGTQQFITHTPYEINNNPVNYQGNTFSQNFYNNYNPQDLTTQYQNIVKPKHSVLNARSKITPQIADLGHFPNGMNIVKRYTNGLDATLHPDSILNNINMSQWDINDPKLPKIHNFDQFDLWPQGCCCFAYNKTQSEQARRHVSGWAMRNTNNHNTQILKKSCLGVLLCTNSGCDLAMRPAICDKARHRQEGKPCPKINCNGTVYMRRCRGHEGYPVTHFWREVGSTVYFQAKGTHDHVKPDLKPVRDTAARRRRQQETISEVNSEQSLEGSEISTKPEEILEKVVKTGRKRIARLTSKLDKPDSSPAKISKLGPSDGSYPNSTIPVKLESTGEITTAYSSDQDYYQNTYTQFYQNHYNQFSNYDYPYEYNHSKLEETTFLQAIQSPSNTDRSGSMLTGSSAGTQNASWSTPSPPNSVPNNTSSFEANFSSLLMGRTNDTGCSSTLLPERDNSLRTPPAEGYFAQCLANYEQNSSFQRCFNNTAQTASCSSSPVSLKVSSSSFINSSSTPLQNYVIDARTAFHRYSGEANSIIPFHFHSSGENSTNSSGRSSLENGRSDNNLISSQS